MRNGEKRPVLHAPSPERGPGRRPRWPVHAGSQAAAHRDSDTAEA
ncbi:hypothetical protein BCL80_104121 [Streptomyces avidinii]|nr:hypothetical protein BCL80_104121 [Streptomyces avidinii]SNX75981.1 hypothetical protein SAMN05421860_102162 [Streptomyces microflavus]